jgi:hypothetical protein
LRPWKASQHDWTEPFLVESSISVPSSPQFVTYRSDRFHVELEERNFRLNTWDSGVSLGSGENVGENIGNVVQVGESSHLESTSLQNPLNVVLEESESDTSSNNNLNNSHLFCEGICLSRIGSRNNSPTRVPNREEELISNVGELNPNRANSQIINEISEGDEEEYQSLDGYDAIDRCEDIAHEIVLRCLRQLHRFPPTHWSVSGSHSGDNIPELEQSRINLLATSSDLIEGEPFSPTTSSVSIVEFASVVPTEEIPSSSHTPLPIVSALIPSSVPELAIIPYTPITIGSRADSNLGVQLPLLPSPPSIPQIKGTPPLSPNR